ncbi:cyclic-phosphate processing receiver domain-containing protein [Burkholderia pseudomallei]|uniref:cyclic-phosphate processing receiver domain-containing protein n=1 Tax=Burkholderia pseudomallei TaxID=28450 RepID=UPI0027E53562|nr:cyclic-phosphate processing receiver domain-containing protein [Burkholderia pseudomallei]
MRSSAEAIDLLQTHGCPKLVSFGHDLGGDDTAMVAVRWLIERDVDQGGQFIPPEFRFQVHSANPVGRENITGLLGGWAAISSSGRRGNRIRTCPPFLRVRRIFFAHSRMPLN